jgi:hypothetical protein
LGARRWCAISGFAGYYVGNVVNLTFGTLGVNDVVAAAMIVGVAEVIGENFWAGYWEGQMCVLRPSLAVSLIVAIQLQRRDHARRPREAVHRDRSCHQLHRGGFC